MFQDIAYLLIFGKPLILYLGLLTLLLFIATAIVGFLIHTGRANIDFKWHIRLAIISFIFAFIHAILAILT